MTVWRSGTLLTAALSAIVLLTTDDAAAQRLESRPQTLWVEAESFAERGGWALDSQAMDAMGSPYLLAHGIGVPVADAKTTVRFPKAGEYKVYARTRNWVAPWRPEEAPGTFQVAVDGKKLETVFGTNGAPWSWQAGGSVVVAEDKLEVEIALCDLTGFDGRVDALVFSADGFVPPEEIDAMKPLRLAARGLSAEYRSVENGKVYDLVVVGGGIAGTAAALSAARLGLSVALVQDRPVLGGNGSSEVRVGLNHFLNLPPYPNLGNLTFLLGPHHGGNAREAEHYRDRTRAELVALETNIDLYLNVRVNVVESAKSESGNVRINAVCGENVATGERLRFIGKTFADCTGDATVGFLAGADFRMGRESKAEYGEPSAPEEADAKTMGSSVQWNTVETDAETRFPELPWAIRFSEKTIRPSIHGDWDWEAGMNLDQIADIERIRDIGLRAAYGHWSYMKNKTTGDWAAKVKNRKLGWVAFVAGKRESRRLLGDVVLREQDILDETPFEDASVTTTWPIDLHYPAPDNVKAFPGEEFRSICKTTRIEPYAIPYRCLYSRNVENLFMAGRNISVTHVALGTVRVMRTGGMMGEVVGMAASICKEHNCLPRDVYASYLDDLKAAMRKGVAPPTEKARRAVRFAAQFERPGWLPQDAKNLARDAKIAVSSDYQGAAKYSASAINDGKFDVYQNVDRWVSDKASTHWVDFEFAEETTLDAVRVVSGQASAQTPLADFRLQVERDGAFVDVESAAARSNDLVIVNLRFNPVSGKRFRLQIDKTPDDLARLWEVEFYRVGPSAVEK